MALNEKDPIESLPVSKRLRHTLVGNGCVTLRDILAKTPLDIKLMRNMGPVGFIELNSFLHEHGLQLKAYED